MIVKHWYKYFNIYRLNKNIDVYDNITMINLFMWRQRRTCITYRHLTVQYIVNA